MQQQASATADIGLLERHEAPRLSEEGAGSGKRLFLPFPEPAPFKNYFLLLFKRRLKTFAETQLGSAGGNTYGQRTGTVENGEMAPRARCPSPQAARQTRPLRVLWLSLGLPRCAWLTPPDARDRISFLFSIVSIRCAPDGTLSSLTEARAFRSASAYGSVAAFPEARFFVSRRVKTKQSRPSGESVFSRKGRVLTMETHLDNQKPNRQKTQPIRYFSRYFYPRGESAVSGDQETGFSH